MSLPMKLPYLPGLANKTDEDRAVLGTERQQTFDLLHGKHYLDAFRGRVFSQAGAPLGQAIPIYTATGIAGGQPIWNPVGSGVNVELINVNIAYASGTATYGAIGLMGINVGISNVATGAAISAFASTTPTNALLGGGLASRVNSSSAGTCTIVAGTAANWLRTLFTFNLEAQTATAHATTGAQVDFDGTVIVPPGWLVFLAAGQATTALFASSVVWKEIPL
jgi:hypothetical protein